VAQSRHVAQRIAEISVQSRQPADSRRQGNPAPNQTVHERRNSPTCSECVAQPSPVTDLGQIPTGADLQYTIQRQILSGPVYSVALEIRKSRRNAEVLFSCSTCSKLLVARCRRPISAKTNSGVSHGKEDTKISSSCNYQVLHGSVKTPLGCSEVEYLIRCL